MIETTKTVMSAMIIYKLHKVNTQNTGRKLYHQSDKTQTTIYYISILTTKLNARLTVLVVVGKE